MTEDVTRVMSAAAIAHQQTGVPITTHSEPRLRNGLDQQAYLGDRGVSPTRIIIGHSGDTDDLGVPSGDHGQRVDDRDGPVRDGAHAE